MGGIYDTLVPSANPYEALVPPSPVLPGASLEARQAPVSYAPGGIPILHLPPSPEQPTDYQRAGIPSIAGAQYNGAFGSIFPSIPVQQQDNAATAAVKTLENLVSGVIGTPAFVAAGPAAGTPLVGTALRGLGLGLGAKTLGETAGELSVPQARTPQALGSALVNVPAAALMIAGGAHGGGTEAPVEPAPKMDIQALARDLQAQMTRNQIPAKVAEPPVAAPSPVEPAKPVVQAPPVASLQDTASKYNLIVKQWGPDFGNVLNVTDPKSGFTLEGITPKTTEAEIVERFKKKGVDLNATEKPVADIRPAIRTMDNTVVVGEKGDVHNDIITKNKLTPERIDRRGFVDATGQWIDREAPELANVPGEPTSVPGAHASGLAAVQETAKPEPRTLADAEAAHLRHEYFPYFDKATQQALTKEYTEGGDIKTVEAKADTIRKTVLAAKYPQTEPQIAAVEKLQAIHEAIGSPGKFEHFVAGIEEPGTRAALRKAGKLEEAQAGVQELMGAKEPAMAALPETASMGGALYGGKDVAQTGPRGEPVHGIRQESLEKAAGQGMIAPVEPGKGTTAPESIEHGRDLIAAGADANKIVEEFNKTKKLSGDDMAIVRAHSEALRRASYAVFDKFGPNSPQAEAAWEADSAFSKAIKPMGTEWHRQGQAMQGETEVDTGTFIGLRRAHFDATGKDFTPEQAKTAQRMAKTVQGADATVETAKDRLFKQLGEAKKSEQAKTIWDAAKRDYLDKGETDFDNIRHGLATDLGIKVETVTKALAEPKGVKFLTDEMYRKMSDRRRVVTQAKNWLKDQQMPGWLRFIRNIPRAFFVAKVFGHGTVGMITHAGMNVFNPATWRTYWPAFVKQFKLVKDRAYHERAMQDLLRDPNFTRARRAGLANEPFHYTDEYQKGVAGWFGKLGVAGNNGFDALKLFRQARFNQIINNLPESLHSPDMDKMVADAVNHSTGTIKMPFREWTNWTFFAPKLEGSRWAWMAGDPLKAARTFTEWKTATPEARQFAVAQLKEKATIAGVYYGLLMANQGLLSAMGSNQTINFTNPRRSDFLAFKAFGHNIGIVSPMLGMVRLFANLYHVSVGNRTKLEQVEGGRGKATGKVAYDYARGKLSPFAQMAEDFRTQADYAERPLPFSQDKVPAYLRRQGVDKYTWPEYATETLLPIPAEEAVKEVWRNQGIPENDINKYLRALIVGVTAGTTGVRVSPDTYQGE